MTPSVDDAALRRSLEAALGANRVRMDDGTRRTYSTDASACVVEPRAVVFVESEDDVLAVLRTCAELAIPLTPRASGTSLSGAAIGPGVVMDTTRFRQILAFDPAASAVRVEPGILLLELNAYLAERGMRFAPDPGSQDLCRIGGMVGHNASGYRSVKYGQTRDHVIGLRVALADGTIVDAHDMAIDGAEWKETARRVPALQRVRQVIEDAGDAILATRRPIRKHACGPDLVRALESLRAGIVPLAPLFVGSEGTLGVVTEATLRVVPLPSRRVTVLLYLDRLADLGPAVATILEARPSAIEGVDGDSLDLVDRGALGVPPSARAMLLVEFDEGDVAAVAAGVVERVRTRHALSQPPEVAEDPGRQAVLWKVRRALFPALVQRPGPRRAWGFVEDPIVPRERVPEFIAFLVDLARRHGTVAAIYGHLGDGNTHYRPFFDPSDPLEFERMCALRREFDDAVLDRFRGAPSGEHGVGRIRAEMFSRVWGPDVYEVHRAIKDALDPRGLLNPGVMLSAEPWWATWGGLESRAPM